MTQRISNSFEADELLQALEICLKSKREESKSYKYWHSAGWSDVVETFGEDKSQSFLTYLVMLEKTFKDVENRLTQTLKDRGKQSYLFDYRCEVVSAFRVEYPSAPSEVVDMLEWDFMYRYR